MFLKGMLKVIDKSQMERFHQGALQVLEKTGLQIRGEFLLNALADAGCRVDFNKQRAWFRPDLVEKQIEGQRDRYKMVRSSIWYPFCEELPEDDVAFPDEFTIDYGHAATKIYDYQGGNYRDPSIQDQIDMIRLGNAIPSVKAVCAPFVCSEFDPRMEIIESTRILLLNTRKPGWVGTSSAREVKYLADFAALACDNNKEVLKTMPPVFVNAYCTTSPLKIDKRSCEVMEQAIKYKFPINIASMPILGGTTPVTPAGSVVVAAAEILGCITAATLIDPDIYYYSTGISAEMDMKTTQICYSTPAAILTDAALHQLFKYKYGIVFNVEAGYVEAKCPGIQASFMKTFRQMAFGCTVSSSLPIGLLDNAAVFSPTQAMIDLDINKALYRFAQGIEVNEETLCPDLINDLEFCEKSTYLENEHTLKHFRDALWDPMFMDRTYGTPKESPNESNEKMLQKADTAWRELLAEEKSIKVDPEYAGELDKIVGAAEKEFLNK